MINYTNGFSCAISDNKKEFLLTFLQTVPKVTETGEIKELSQEQVATFVMNIETMLLLRNALDTILENSGIAVG